MELWAPYIRSCTFYIVDFTEIRFSWQLCCANSSFDRSCVLQIRKGIWRLTTIPTPEMPDFTFLGPHHSLQSQAPFLVHFWNWTKDSSNKLPPRGTVEDLPPDSPSVRLMIFLDGLQGKAAGCLAKPKQQPGSNPEFYGSAKILFFRRKSWWINTFCKVYQKQNNRVQIWKQRTKNECGCH